MPPRLASGKVEKGWCDLVYVKHPWVIGLIVVVSMT